MTSLAFYASPIEESTGTPAQGSSTKRVRHSTFKKKPSPLVEKMIEEIHGGGAGGHRGDEDSPDMGSFNPPAPPEPGKQKKIGEHEGRPDTQPVAYAGGDAPVGPVKVEGFADGTPGPGHSGGAHSYLPYYTATAGGMGGGSPSGSVHGDEAGRRDELLKKLDYMIHLLEEQHEEKTGHVAEEVVLYSFLGVFVIFVVDSFARAGKYVR